MPKFLKSEEELESDFDKWMYIFKNLPKLDKMPARIQGKRYLKNYSDKQN